jgi:coatomer subunit gamma
VGDNFRSHIIKAVRQLALTYPAKHKVLLAFLAEEIQEEASFEVKKDLIETIGSLMHDNPQVV